MLESLKVIYQMLDEINRSVKNKEDLLKKHLRDPIFGKTLRKVLEYITNETLIFSLKKINFCVFFEDKIAAEHQNVASIFQMLDFIITKETYLSDDEISFFEKISSSDPETIETVMRILNKESGCGLMNNKIKEILEEKL